MGKKKKGGNSPRGNQGGAKQAANPPQAATANPEVKNPTGASAVVSSPEKPVVSSPKQQEEKLVQQQQGNKPSPQKQDVKAADPKQDKAEPQKQESPSQQKQAKRTDTKQEDKPVQQKQDSPAQPKQQKKTEQKAPPMEGTDSPQKPQKSEAAEGGEKTKAQLKAERRAKFEAEQKAKLEAEKAAGGGEKSKAQLKAERRAVQEAQRASKLKESAEGKAGGTGEKAAKDQAKKPQAKEGPRVSDSIRLDDEKARKRLQRKLDKEQIPARTVAQRKVSLFNHLHQYEKEVSLTRDVSFNVTSGLPEPILALGLRYADGINCGSNSRCVALLKTLDLVIQEYKTPESKELSRDLESKIKRYLSFLSQCRPMSVSMGNAVKYLKHAITQIPADMSEERAKLQLHEFVLKFMWEKIILAGRAIAQFASNKIQDGDVVMIYACSSLIRAALTKAHKSGKKFRVVVVDSRPKLEGEEMMRRLVKAGIPCTYVLINSASYIMSGVTKVLLGAHGLLANGWVMGRVGNSQVALLARRHNIPVMVCCETYKFCERVHTDSFVFNELGDPDDLVNINRPDSYLGDWRDLSNLTLLNLTYDLTPPDLISVVISEMDMLPCTSVPVVLRVKHAENA